jgi:hypothetical protein
LARAKTHFALTIRAQPGYGNANDSAGALAQNLKNQLEVLRTARQRCLSAQNSRLTEASGNCKLLIGRLLAKR